MEKMRCPTATSLASWESKERATVKLLRMQNTLNQERVNETSCVDTDGDFNRWPATSQSLHHESDGTRRDWSEQYEKVHASLQANAWLVGRVTMAEMSRTGPTRHRAMEG